VWFRRGYIHLFGLQRLLLHLVCVGEFLLHLLPCFVFSEFNPFSCLLMVKLYQDEVGFFNEFRHYPVLILLAVGVVAWCARRERRERVKPPLSRT
jgi:hypothetical protein